MLIAMAGLQGVGKSTVAQALAARLPAVLVSVDEVESALCRAELERSFSTGLAAYLVAEEVAAANLRLGAHVVVDAANYVGVARRTWTSLAGRLGVPLLFVDVVCTDLGLHKRRVEARHRGLPGLPEVTFDDVVERYAETEAWGDEPRIMLDSALPLDVADLVARVTAAAH